MKAVQEKMFSVILPVSLYKFLKKYCKENDKFMKNVIVDLLHELKNKTHNEKVK